MTGRLSLIGKDDHKKKSSMKKLLVLLLGASLAMGYSAGQQDPFQPIRFLFGEWEGEGSGFGNEKSQIESGFQPVMDDHYIEVINDSRFEPTERNPEGEHHVDKGFISYDQARETIVYRQFNVEGYMNQYVLNDVLSSDSTVVFETEFIENLPGGKARWTIRKKPDGEIETTFDVSFSGNEFTCFGVNRLRKR
jgi:hypothetical protein